MFASTICRVIDAQDFAGVVVSDAFAARSVGSLP
jgi:hypothetical protein